MFGSPVISLSHNEKCLNSDGWDSLSDRKADYIATVFWQKTLSILLQEDRTLSLNRQINYETNSAGQSWFRLADTYSKKEMRDGHSATNTLSVELRNTKYKSLNISPREKEHLHCDKPQRCLLQEFTFTKWSSSDSKPFTQDHLPWTSCQHSELKILTILS